MIHGDQFTSQISYRKSTSTAPKMGRNAILLPSHTSQVMVQFNLWQICALQMCRVTVCSLFQFGLLHFTVHPFQSNQFQTLTVYAQQSMTFSIFHKHIYTNNTQITTRQFINSSFTQSLQWKNILSQLCPTVSQSVSPAIFCPSVTCYRLISLQEHSCNDFLFHLP